MKINYSLRSARSADAFAIRMLIYRTELTPLGLNWRRFIIAASHSGELVGCGQIKLHRNHLSELSSLAVVDGWRRQGVAQSLISELLDRHQGSLYLICQESLQPLYEKFEFRPLSDQDIPAYFLRARKLSSWGDRLFGHKERLIVMLKSP